MSIVNPAMFTKYDTPFGLMSAMGVIADIISFEKFGRNPTAGTGDDIWANDGVWTPAATAAKINVSSSSVNDTAAGTGARTIYIEGLNGDYDITSETLSLNGTSAVETVNSYLNIHRGYVVTAGSGGALAGDITGVSQASGTPTLFKMLQTAAQTNLAMYIVPRNYSLYVKNIGVAFQSTNVNGTADITIRAKPFGGVYRTRGNFALSTGVGNVEHDYNYQLVFPEKTAIKFTCVTASHTADVCVYGTGFLVKLT